MSRNGGERQPEGSISEKPKVRNSHFPIGLFGAIYGLLLLMSGVHTGLIELFTVWDPADAVKTMIPLLYWSVISFGITAFVRGQMKKTYEIPIKKLAKATDDVAHGDFSVYVAPLHTPDKLDYLDVMIMDFNKMVEDLEERVLVLADRSLMELVWSNLISNALKFTEKNGRVVLREFSTDQEIFVTISDNGCGMSQSTMNHIFEKFYQGDTSHAAEGNGLGLALAFRILELSEGQVQVESEVGVGTSFRVRLKKHSPEGYNPAGQFGPENE